MTVLREFHEDYGASFVEVGDRDLPEDYGRPERTQRAVRNAAGATEMAYGVLVVTGDDRVDFVDNAVSNRVPETDGEGCYALLLDAQARVRTDMYVYNADDKLLVFTPPETAGDLVEEWRENVFIEDVEIRNATTDFAVFGVHGPKSTEKIASVLHGGTPPDDRLTFDRGRINEAGVTVVRTDALAGEEGYDVVCAAEDAETVFDTLLTRGLNAAPFGRTVWEALTLEAGTPLFEYELRDRIPNVAGVRNALDFEKGCYVGQEIVSKVENRGRPSKRLVGVRLDDATEGGAEVLHDGDVVGEITRVRHSHTLDAHLALAYVDFDTPADATLAVDDIRGELEPLPFVEGSDRSARLPTY